MEGLIPISLLLMSMDWFVGENLQETHGFLPSNRSGFPGKIFPSSSSMMDGIPGIRKLHFDMGMGQN
jgi:hypothetical protein